MNMYDVPELTDRCDFRTPEEQHKILEDYKIASKDKYNTDFAHDPSSDCEFCDNESVVVFNGIWLCQEHCQEVISKLQSFIK